MYHLHNYRAPTSYNNRNYLISTSKDLGIIISSSWNIHHDAVLWKAYRTLGLVQRTFSTTIHSSAKVKLYTYRLLGLNYCTINPNLIRYQKLKQPQHQGNKYI